ncbi:Ldh family oxidoreductase, partial [Ruegeria sp. NA]
MTETQTLSLAEIEKLSFTALVAAGTSEENARPLAVATAATEADGVASHGLAYIPIYCEHVQCGKVDGQAVPTLETPRPGLIRVDAATGFAHAAIEMGFDALIPAAREQGIAALAITNSYNCGVLGYHTYRLAQAGLVGLGFTNAPASIAPSGGSKPVVGTNPFSVAVPGPDGQPALLIDQSASTIAKSEVMKHAREGKAIPVGWALDPDGNPTT